MELEFALLLQTTLAGSLGSTGGQQHTSLMMTFYFCEPLTLGAGVYEQLEPIVDAVLEDAPLLGCVTSSYSMPVN